VLLLLFLKVTQINKNVLSCLDEMIPLFVSIQHKLLKTVNMNWFEKTVLF